MNKVVDREDFLKETYPNYKAAGYTLNWLENGTVEIHWNLGQPKTSVFTVDDLLKDISSDKPIGEALDSFVYSKYPLDALEASRYGSLGFSSKVEKWVVFSVRPDGSIAKVFLSSFSSADQEKLMNTWENTFNSHYFKVVPQSLILEIISNRNDMNSTHCLSSESSLKKALADAYEISDDVCVLIDDKPNGSILIGHKDAVERLAQIPGSNYCLKTYQEIKNELWRKNVK